MDFNIRAKVMGSGLENIDKIGSKIASSIESTDNMNQVDILKLQQQITSYSNTISMMSNMLKSLADTDKEVIRAM